MNLPDQIIEICLKHSGITFSDLLETSTRSNATAACLGIVGLMLHKHANMSWPEIGIKLGRNTHSGVRDAAIRYERVIRAALCAEVEIEHLIMQREDVPTYKEIYHEGLQTSFGLKRKTA